MDDAYGIWQRADAAREIDELAGFLASRRPGTPQDHRNRDEAARRAASGRAAVAAGDLGAALDRCLDLRDLAHPWAGHPHHPDAGRPAEQDARTWDHAKDMPRADLAPGDPRLHEAGMLRDQVVRTLRRIDDHPDADERARQDAHYLAGRAAMALALGHVPAARWELGRVQELLARYEGGEN
ncbi:hypothetical protein ACIPW5_27990 [Streptomyces sp. NPDC090077]|uniref:hypothetical protein n=1 Tax=Streptomyces sp. NPDC090077 TaxID=3365938 RepID=UPI0038241C92